MSNINESNNKIKYFHDMKSNAAGFYIPKGKDDLAKYVTDHAADIAKAIYCSIMRYGAHKIELYYTTATTDADGISTTIQHDVLSTTVPNLKEYPNFTHALAGRLVCPASKPNCVAVGVRFKNCSKMEAYRAKKGMVQ